MPARELKTTLEAIKKKKYAWEADETTISALSTKEQKQMLGLVVDKKELEAMARLIEAETSLETFNVPFSALPAKVDWRNKGGDWTTPIKDQKSCGSCVSFGVAATIESKINIACKKPNVDKDLSEAHLFYCGCGKCCGRGWNFAPALDFCKKTGVALESSFPYTPGDQPCKSGVRPYLKITAWKKILTIADRKKYLATKGPMVAGMAVYADFSHYSSGVYRRTSNTLNGYHAICVVGYDDNEECWICKNSWGTGWGDSGWFKIGYGECKIDSTFPFFHVDVNCPDPCGNYLPYLKKVLKAAKTNSRLQACLCYHVCRKGSRPRCSRAELRIVETVVRILHRCPRYRVSFCRALQCVDPCKRYVPYLRRVITAASTNARLRACLCYYLCRRGRSPRCAPAEMRVVRTVILMLRRCPQYRAPFCRGIRC